MPTAIERTKYMDVRETEQLRTVTEAWSITDMGAGRRQGVLTWMVVDTALLTGLRVSELAKIRVGDFDPRRSLIQVSRHKRRDPTKEPLAIPPKLVKHLKEFIAWKELLGQSTGDKKPLFVGKRGPLSVQGFQQLWKRAIDKAGLPHTLSIHSARHTVAVQLLKKTKNLRQVQKQLGHTDPATTANMYADVSFEDMKSGLTDLYEDNDLTMADG